MSRCTVGMPNCFTTTRKTLPAGAVPSQSVTWLNSCGPRQTQSDVHVLKNWLRIIALSKIYQTEVRPTGFRLKLSHDWSHKWLSVRRSKFGWYSKVNPVYSRFTLRIYEKSFSSRGGWAHSRDNRRNSHSLTFECLQSSNWSHLDISVSDASWIW